MEAIIKFKNINDIDKQLKDEATCRAYYEQLRWNGEVGCPHCGSAKVYQLKRSKHQNEYKCGDKDCYKKFNCLTGTIFENTKISLIVWFKAIHLSTTLSKGISSVNLAAMIGITQKSAWFLLHRIRVMLTDQAPVMLEGEVEIDETFHGGKETNKHLSKRRGKIGTDGKTPVLGLVQRDGKLICRPVPTVTGKHILPIMRASVKHGSTIITDSHLPYRKLKDKYLHESVNHRAEEYVRGNIHTNQIEGAWGLFKRKINGIHHFVSPKHLHRYCNEFAFSYNNRKTEGYDKFNLALKNCESRLRYQELIKG